MPERRRKRRSRSKRHDGLPKGAHRLPDGNYVTTSSHRSPKTGRVLRIEAVHHAEPDAKLVAQALIALAIEQAHERADH